MKNLFRLVYMIDVWESGVHNTFELKSNSILCLVPVLLGLKFPTYINLDGGFEYSNNINCI